MRTARIEYVPESLAATHAAAPVPGCWRAASVTWITLGDLYIARRPDDAAANALHESEPASWSTVREGVRTLRAHGYLIRHAR